MKIILIGYPGSQCIVPASKFLTANYIRAIAASPLWDYNFSITYLNYKGEINGWSKYLIDHLSQLTDENIIFALDDYLIAECIDMDKYKTAEAEMKGDVVCIKLCQSTPEEHAEYPVTTQYCIWNREYLIGLLTQIKTPWEFEMTWNTVSGTKKIDKKVLLRTCIFYFCNSSISARWEGIRFDGLKEEDVKYIKENLLSEKKIVVFGGSGFLGTALIERLVANGNTNIIAVSRNEGELVKLREKFSAVRIIIGDIADPWVVRKAMQNADEVYLLSALKHVGLAETEVRSCISTNIVGCMNVIDESLITKPKVLLFISTDKAAQTKGIYGCSKRIGEKLIAEAEKINSDTKYRIIRYGNVWGSTGSIITKWKPKMQKGEEIILTDPDASRFFWGVTEAVDLIFRCIEKATDSTPYIPEMKAVSMGIVAEACMQVYGKSPVKIIGLQPGENKTETMDGITFSDQVEQFTKEEFINKFLLWLKK